jgi:hypothetical protein
MSVGSVMSARAIADALLLAPRELVGVVVHAVGEAHHASAVSTRSRRSRLPSEVRSRGSSTFSKAFSTGIRL